jgi:hypothetical protein
VPCTQQSSTGKYEWGSVKVIKLKSGNNEMQILQHQISTSAQGFMDQMEKSAYGLRKPGSIVDS